MKEPAEKNPDLRGLPLSNAAAATRRILGGSPGSSASAPRIRPEWLGYYRALLGLRDRLLGERAHQLRTATDALEPHSTHIADSATDEFDHDLVLAELEAEHEALYELDEALRRLIDGTYGICEMTGKPIPAARLRAVPWTRFSREAECSLERNQKVPKHYCLGKILSLGASIGATFGEVEEFGHEQADPVAEDEKLTILTPGIPLKLRELA